MSKLVLIDGNSLINRAFYATPPLTNKDGISTNAVFGFVNMLIKVINDVKPDHILVAFDRREPTFRHKMYTEYKGTRKPMPEDLRPQIPLLKEVLTKMGIKIYDKAGFEADDIIGTVAKKYTGETIIITGDKDSFQLVDEKTSVYFTRRGISDIDILDNNNFKEKTGILPCQVTDLKACMGDSSDNIPGIVGVGEKTAHTLIETYQNIENIYQNLGEFKGKLLEKIANGKDLCFLSKVLATIDVNVDIDLKEDDLGYIYPFNDDAKRIFTKLEFRGFLKRSELFSSEETVVSNNTAKSVNIVEITPSTDIESLLKSKEITVVIDDKISFYNGDGNEYKLKIKEMFFDEGFLYSDAVKLFKNYFENQNNKVICYGAKKLAYILKEFDISFNAQSEDVDILKYLLDFKGKEESLKDTLYYYQLDEKTPAYSLNVLFNKFIKQLKEEYVERLYYDVELPLWRVLFDMESQGFKIDLTELDNLSKQYKEELNNLTKQIILLAGEEFNINSPKQLGYIIYEKLNLGKGKKTKTGSMSTSAEQLESLISTHEIVPLILRYRQIQKLYSTYIEGFRPLIDKNTGIVHTVFNQTLTQTGRLSSKEPNLQNIPVKTEEGRVLRKLFIAKSDDNLLIDADYSQIELRLLAHFSQSEELVKAYKEDKDIHQITASQVFNVSLDKVTKSMRSSAKAVNFGIIYGISEYGLAKNLKISPKDAKNYIERYYESYPSVKEYMAKNVDFARKNGYVSTILNRRRYIKEINSSNFNLRSFGERASMNMPLQGSSADIIKIAMVNVYNKLNKENLKAKLILQVHDELIIDCPKNELEIVKGILVNEMQNSVKLRVPLLVEANVGKTWFEAK